LTRLQVSKHPRVSQKRLCDNGAPLPSAGSARPAFPDVLSSIRALRHPATSTALLMYSLRRPHLPSPSVRSHAAETSAGPGPAISRGTIRYFEVGRSQGLPGSWRIHPIPLPRSTIPAGPTDLTLSVHPMQSPLFRQRGHQRFLFRNSITRLQYPLSTLQVVRYRTRRQDSLPAGG
jgi:hypothetical protein